MNSAAFRASLDALADLTGKELTPNITRWWWQRYGDLPDAVLTQAFEIACETCKFFPSPAEFNGILAGLAERGGALLTGAAAWDALDRDVLRTYAPGITLRIAWPDQRSRDVLRLQMGKLIHDVCQMHPAQLATVREEFIRRYDASRAADTAQATLDRLVSSKPKPAISDPRNLRLVSGEE
ncbi:MAG: hypothetical protein ACTHMU_08140 [Thermomicrobiales bacterium]